MKIATSLNVTLLLLAAITSCNKGFNATATDDTNRDTIWADDRSYWEIKQPFEENGRTVLYRSHVILENADDNELSYYMLPRETADYDSCRRRMQSITAGEFTGVSAELDTSSVLVPSGNTPIHWYPVRKYRGNFYVYQDANYGIYLSNDLFITAYWDFCTYKLKNVEKLADGSYDFLLEKEITAKMELVDKEKGLFRFRCKDIDIGDYFTIDQYIENYDIIMAENNTPLSIDGIEFDK